MTLSLVIRIRKLSESSFISGHYNNRGPQGWENFFPKCPLIKVWAFHYFLWTKQQNFHQWNAKNMAIQHLQCSNKIKIFILVCNHITRWPYWLVNSIEFFLAEFSWKWSFVPKGERPPTWPRWRRSSRANQSEISRAQFVFLWTIRVCIINVVKII